jgi:UDP-N-acetylmuramate--alanine ligase
MPEFPLIPHRIHIVGAGGAGMSGLAKLLQQSGHHVTGSDVKPGPMLELLADVGVETWIGHRPEAMADVELVVASSAVPASDSELESASASGAMVWRRPALLSALTRAMPTTGLAGTHGKTTSTALMVSAMRAVGGDPSFLVGGRMIGLNAGAHMGADDRFVLEADEAFGTFRHLDLDSILVTNIEADHLDHYGTLASLEDAFAQVVAGVSGPRVACIDDPGVRRLARRTDVTTYGFSESADWVLSDIEHPDGGVAFTLAHGADTYSVAIPKPGEHLALNAAGVLVVLDGLGHDVAAAADAMSRFEGVRRRYEIRARVGGVTIVDDYAHHPTEVAATIAAARHGTRASVIAVFQPHRYTRTADLAAHFGEPLALADTVIVTDVYAAGETPIIGVSGRLVAESVDAAGGNAAYVPRLRDVADRVADTAEPGDTVLLLGAGDINSIVRDIATAIRSK